MADGTQRNIETAVSSEPAFNAARYVEVINAFTHKIVGRLDADIKSYENNEPMSARTKFDADLMKEFSECANKISQLTTHADQLSIEQLAQLQQDLSTIQSKLLFVLSSGSSDFMLRACGTGYGALYSRSDSTPHAIGIKYGAVKELENALSETLATFEKQRLILEATEPEQP